MAGGVNNFGTTIGPLIVSFAIFGSATASNTNASIESVKVPYLILGLAFVLVAVFYQLSSIHNNTDLNPVSAGSSESDRKFLPRNPPIQYAQLVRVMIGIFVYVGV